MLKAEIYLLTNPFGLVRLTTYSCSFGRSINSVYTLNQVLPGFEVYIPLSR